MKLLRLLANLGYGSRRDVGALFADGRVTDVAGERLYVDDVREHAEVRLDGEPLDPAAGMAAPAHTRMPAAWSTICCQRDSACAARPCPQWVDSIATPVDCSC